MIADFLDDADPRHLEAPAPVIAPVISTAMAPAPVIAPVISTAMAPPAAPRAGPPAGITPARDEPSPVVLEVRGLSKTFVLKEGLFRRRRVLAVRDVSFTLRRGRTLGLVGESGCGKTTVGLAVLRLLQADAGQVLFQGVDLQTLPAAQWLGYRRRLQIIFQNPYASLNPRFTIARTLIEPMRIHSIGADDAERHRLAGALIERVGLPADAMARYPHEFSGGQRQRLAIARVLTMRPEVVICDESVSALDVSVQAQVLNLLRDLQDEYGLSYLFISHDLAVVRYLADEVMVMKDGAVIEAGDSERLYREPREDYTRSLIGAIPRGLVTSGS